MSSIRTNDSRPQVDSLIAAAFLGDVARMEALLQAGRDVNARDASGNTSVAYAAQNGHIAAVDALLAAGADPMPAGQMVRPR